MADVGEVGQVGQVRHARQTRHFGEVGEGWDTRGGESGYAETGSALRVLLYEVPAARGLGAAGSPFWVGRRDFDGDLGWRVWDFQCAVDGEVSVWSDAGGAEDGVAGEIVLAVMMLLLSY